MGGERRPGSVNGLALGDDWIDRGTMCVSRSNLPGVSGLDVPESWRVEGLELSLRAPGRPAPRLTIEIEGQDTSIGQARYKGATPVSANLSTKPTVAGRKDDIIIHANVEVHLFDIKGREVPMTFRESRTWDIQPLPNAVVEDLRMWSIVDLDQPDDSPFGLSVASKFPSQLFELDQPTKLDAPGAQIPGNLQGTRFGQVQEFLAGNPSVGGFYYQIYVLADTDKIRVMTSPAVALSAAEFRAAKDFRRTKEFAKSMKHKFMFSLCGGSSSVTYYSAITVKPAKGRK